MKRDQEGQDKSPQNGASKKAYEKPELYLYESLQNLTGGIVDPSKPLP
ncbi:hypothetical protein [Desulfoferrobacter suflitae]|nr:hypothetical protein [Desulfoferrobacter suflitae]MCK8602751.1 hypothetical protein [Desulfoferrobacter suflitae]